MKITSLRTNGLKDPIGYEYPWINLSWQITETKTSHSDFAQVRISKSPSMENVMFDSGVLSEFRECSYTVQLDLKPRTRYYWQVMVKDSEKNEGLSEIAFFETGKMNEKWQGKWIGVHDRVDRMPCIYKKISISKKVKSARAYIYGLGLYEAYINNQLVGDEFLLPGYHSYDLTMEYQTFDITDYIIEGTNRFHILLGEGWYKGRFGFEGGFSNLYGNQKKCIVEIYITLMDGTELFIPSNKDWMAIESNILENGIYDGEWRDDTLPSNELSVFELEETKSLLVERSNPPIRKTKILHPKEIIHHEGGYLLLDFGEMITGWVEIEGNFLKGQTIAMYYGEILQNDGFYNDNLRSAKSEYHYISDGTRQRVRPHFTFYGFRYVKVEGLNDIQNMKFIAFHIMSDIKQIGFIKTSNQKVNQLFDNTVRSQMCNFLDIPTDCPQRDERMGWTGDAAIFARTACFHMDSSAFFNHYLKNLRLEQKELKGSVPFFVPNPKVKPFEGINPFYVSSGASVWGDVATLLPWTLYEYTGNKDLLQEYYPIMCSWVDYITSRSKECEKPYLWLNDDQLGDWLALDNGNIHNPIGKTDSKMIASAYYYYSTSLCEKAAKVLSDSREEEYDTLAANIKQAFIKEYFNEANELTSDLTQTACALLLNFGLYPEQGKEKLQSSLEQLINENNQHLNTGFVGTPILCPELSKNGLNHMAYTLLLNEDYPSWLFEVNLGATTIWERWNSVLEDGSISGTEMNSLNHYAYGSIADWMYRYMCGFHPSMGCEIKMTIKPMPDIRIKTVSGQWESPYGIYRCEWFYDDVDDVHYKIEIPFNGNAKTIINNQEHMLNAGIYFFDTNGILEISE